MESLDPVARTMLIPLWARAAETRKKRPLVHDARALEICDRIDFDFGVFRHAHGSQIGCVVRGLLYDAWTEEFLRRHPHGTVVEIGAGLSTRFERIDNGTARWVDVDLPAAIALRSEHILPTERRRFVAVSAADPSWAERVEREMTRPSFFVCEGTFMYLAPDDVKAFLRTLADRFGPTAIALDSISPGVVRHQRLHDAAKHMMDAPFRWGTDDIRELERWDSRLVVDEVLTLPDIADRFESRVALHHRIVGRLVRGLAPAFADAYRIAKVLVRR